MNRLEEINGQQVAVEAIIASHQREHKEISLLLASPGIGTSWVLERCTTLWEDRGNIALSTKGVNPAPDRRLFPWLTMILPGMKRFARLEVLKQTVAETSRSVPVFGQSVSFLVDEVLNHTKRRLSREALFLTEQEQDLLYVVQATAGSKRLMLTLDRPDLWDESSWDLLGLILSGRVDELYPALKNSIIVIGIPEPLPLRLQKLLMDFTVREFRLRSLDLADMPVASQTFGFPALSRVEMDRLYKVTNGRLDLLRDVTQHFHSNVFTSFSEGWDNVYCKLMQKRMLSLSNDISELGAILSAAAVVGSRFTIKDIACLTGSAIDSISAAVQLATREHILNAVGDLVEFESTEAHKFFDDAAASERAKYHSKFAECLRIMRPGDYGHRRQHLFLAGQTEDALTCFALSALSARRQHRSAPSAGELVKAPGWPEVKLYLDQMFAAFDAYEDQRVEEGLETLEEIESFLPEALIAERDYLHALLLLTTPSVTNYSRARSLLQRWETISGTEGELWERLAQTLLVALAQTGRLDDARQLEAKLTAEYWQRRAVDPWALHGLNVLRRRAECLHSLPTAAQRLAAALEYFRGATEVGMPRNPIQYYYTLTNLIGNTLVRGQFEEATAQAVQLEGLIHNFGSLNWPMPEVAANNSILARYLSGVFDAEGAAGLLGKVFTESSQSGDRILLQNNYAVLLILAGRPKEGEALLDRGYSAISSGEEPDGYHRYFLNNNIAVLRALAGDLSGGQELIQEGANILDQFYPAIQATMARRHELLSEAIKEAPQLTPTKFNTFLLDRFPLQVGSQWAFYGHAFLLTDIQFWFGDQ